MIDITVARDKLAGFETADEIAQFFTDQGIKGTPGNTKYCVISEWMHNVTGDLSIYTYGNFMFSMNRHNYDPISHSPAMVDFVENFDGEKYPNLIQQEEK